MENLRRKSPYRSFSIKFGLVMKLTFLLHIVSVITVYASVNAQNARVTLKLNNVRMQVVLEKIESSTDFKFVYNNQKINTEKLVTIEADNEILSSILNRLFNDSNISYKLQKKLIILKPKKDSAVLSGSFGAPIPNITPNELKQQVSGTVTDADGESLPGANVLEKGTSNGVVTDVDGNFSITVDEGAILVVSYIGFATREIPVENRTNISIQLEESLEGLDEVVVVGYGTVKKRDLTGSVKAVEGDVVNRTLNSSLEQGLQGRVAGVQIVQGNASPGGAPTVRIRGGNTVLGGNAPLYVIDGFPINNNVGRFVNGETQPSNPLATLNPNDIELITVLKDASATAIYGARASNGVILIETKRGREGRTKVVFDTSLGIQNVQNRYELMGRESFMEIVNERFAFQGLDTPYPNFSEFPNETDWQDEMFTSAIVQSHNLTVSGGGASGKYAVSANHFGQDGVLKNTGFDRSSLRVNLDNNITEKLKFKTNVFFSKSRYQRGRTAPSAARGVIYSGLAAPPNVPIRNEDGSFFDIGTVPGSDPEWDNPVFVLEEYSNEFFVNRVLGSTNISYDITNNLSISTRLGADISNELTEIYEPIGIKSAAAGMATVNNTKVENYLSELLLNYNKDFGDDHSITTVIGGTYQTEDLKTYRQSGTGFNQDAFRTFNLGAAATTNPNSSNREEWTILSGLGRINYTMFRKYLFTASIRADGSSRFGQGNKWGIFPSGAFAWKVSQEKFMSSVDLINDLKLRTSFGVTGNQEIGTYQSLGRLGSTVTAIGQNETQVVGFNPASLENQSLSWETSVQFDVGIDLSIMDSKLNLTADYYVKRTTDLLAPVQLPASSGFRTMIQNTGEIMNRGLEIGVTTYLANSNDFNWSLSGNLSFYENEVVTWATEEAFAPPLDFPISSPLNLIREGEPLSVFYGYQEAGLDEQGLIQYTDQNGDGDINADDRIVLGSAYADYTYNFSSELDFKGLDFSIFFQGSAGNDVFNYNAWLLGDALSRESNQLVEVENRWNQAQPDPNAPYPRANSEAQLVSNRHVQDASFFRLRNIIIGYTIAIKNIDSLRMYIAGDNLFVWTKYNGFDPEVNSYGGSDLRIGVDMGTYPTARTVRLGLNVTF